MKALPVPSVDCLSVIVGFEGLPYLHACTILIVTVNFDPTLSHQICSFPPACIIHNYSRLRSEVFLVLGFDAAASVLQPSLAYIN
jgi:hypothetical protein